MASFAEVAPPQWQDWLDTALTGPAVLTTQRVADEIARTPLGTSVAIEIPQWTDATGEHITLLHEVERRVDESIRADLSDCTGPSWAGSWVRPSSCWSP